MTSTIGTTSTSAANAAPTNLKSTDTSSRSSRITSQLHSKAIGTGRVEKARDLGKVYLREDDISRRIPHAITLIYNPLSTKCKQCGIRFPRVPPSSSASSLSQSEKISSHMDFHFRLNRKQKESVKRLASRIWYPSLKEWIGGDVTGGGSKLNGKEEGGPVFFNMDGENQGLFDEQGDGGSNSASREKSKLKGKEEKDQKRYDEMRCIAPANNAKLKCVVCNEGFEVVWDEDEEEWMMKNAVKGDGNEVDKYGTDGDWWVHASCSDGGDMVSFLFECANGRHLYPVSNAIADSDHQTRGSTQPSGTI
ncbi:hypothetical protein BKA69DRAFT_1061225 [Paraphysoderma sedebokerense]|nr:hypothetical protein BKA69DRAFT_1061225 [Paraphysoderma sedebokerense]